MKTMKTLKIQVLKSMIFYKLLSEVISLMYLFEAPIIPEGSDNQAGVMERAIDKATAKALWELSEHMTGISWGYRQFTNPNLS